jgi:glyoxylase-like metal-dependent hydrolase (beta-lactamase superfamily II)
MRIIRQGANFVSAELDDLVITALHDGTVDVGRDYLLEDGRPVEAPAALPVWAFHIQGPDGAMLLDCGGGETEPTTGGLSRAMIAAGIDPHHIMQVALTHPHFDHMGGLIGASARRIVPKLEKIWVPAEDLAMCRARLGNSPLSGKIIPLEQGDGPMRGVIAVQMPGHMAGHMGYLVDGRLMIWGDVVHVPAVQFARPRASSRFDLDRDQARETRLAVFGRAVSDGLMVAGSHLDHPAMGWLRHQDDGYAFDPLGDNTGNPCAEF